MARRGLRGDYHMQHRAPGREGAPLFDLTANGVYPCDVYDRSRDYVGNPEHDYDALAVIRRFRCKPDAPVTVYRAVPKAIADEWKRLFRNWERRAARLPTDRLNELDDPPRPPIHPGDWVALSERYARDHALDLEGRGKNGGVVSMRVRVKHLYTDGNSFSEWGYDPD